MAARRLTPGGPAAIRSPQESIVGRLVADAIRRGADFLEVEYKDGYEVVVAGEGGVGLGIARFRSSSPEALTLREELSRLTKRKHRVTVDGSQYELRGSVYESFGEAAFRVQLHRL